MQRRATKIRRKRREQRSPRRSSKRERRGRREEKREEAVALRRVATSCTKGSDRTSYLTRACCAFLRPPSSGSPLIPFPPQFLSLFLSFLCVCSACLRFILSPARALVGSNLCLSLSLLVWFVGSRLGTVITEYPPLTSGTLVVLSSPRVQPPSSPNAPGTNAGWRRTVCGQEQVGPTYHHLPRLPDSRLGCATFSGTVLPRYFVPRLFPSPSLTPFSFFRLASSLSHSYSTSSSSPLSPSSLSHILPVLSSLLLPRFSSFVSPFFRCCFCALSLFLFSTHLAPCLPVFLSLAFTSSLTASRTNYLCLISDTVATKR